MAWLSGWSKRIKLTIDSGKVDDALADFPVLVYLSGSSGIGGTDVSAVFDEIGSNSLKIAITQSNGTTQCYVEIEKWDSANEKAWLWVKIPSISDSANTDLYLYYDSTHEDNTTYVGVIGSTPGQNVWDSDFVTVHHLTGANYTDLDDSTANNNDVDSASGDPSYNATGKVASCIDLDGNDVVQISYDSSLVPSSEITVECIVKPNIADNIDYARFISVWHVTYGNGYLLRLDNASSPISQFYISDSGGVTRGPAQSTTTINNTSLWYALAGKFTGSALKLLINGSEEGSFDFTGSLNTSISTPLTIGGDFAASQTCFNGLIEEVRISKVARSDAWLKATYHNCWDSLITFSSEEKKPWLSGWSKRIKLIIDSGKVDAALADFPILVYLSGSSGIGGTDVSAIFDEIGSNSLKIAVTQSDGKTQCYVEIEKWDSANEKAWLWVKIPSISDSANTDLYLYYDSTHEDNSTYVGTIGSTPGQNVWDANFDAIYHLGQDPTGGSSCILDSTGNGNNGTPGGSMTSGDLVDGKIAKAIDFDGSNDEIDLGQDTFSGTSGTIEAIIKFNNLLQHQTYFSSSDIAEQNDYLKCECSTAGLLRFQVGGTNIITGNTDLYAGIYYYTVCRSNGTAWSIFINDALESLSVVGSNTGDWFDDIPNGPHDTWIGRWERSTSSRSFNGIIDEIRISNIERSESWIKATYHTCWDSLITFGSEETAPVDIELAIPAFAASSNLLSTINIQLSIPPMTGQSTLSMDQIFFGRFIQCEPFSSVSSLTGTLFINLVPPVMASQSELKVNIEFQLSIPVFAGIGILSLSDVFLGRYVSAPAFNATGSLNCDLAIYLKNPAFVGHGALLVTPCIQLALDPFDAVASLHMASVNKFNIESAEIYYTFVLTGKNDGTTDITIPISSFQARLRSGDPTYLSVVVPGMDHAGAISARPNGEMIVYMNYLSGGLLLQTEEIIRADLEDINISKGAKSRSIVLTGHRTTTTGGKNVTLRNPTYRNLYRGKFTYRCATPDIFLRPGDTVICGDDTFDVELITYVVSVAQQSMEITGI